MHHSNRWMVVVLIIAGLQLSACQRESDRPTKIESARLEQVQGTELSRVILTAKAAERLGIKTAPVRDVQATRSRTGTQRTVVPYAAVLYGAHGDTWVYISPGPLVFVRHRISVDYIEGDRAVLSNGPPSGIEVVTVGAALLFGTEFKVGH